MTYFLGIDVGTGSARAGLFSPDGRLADSAAVPIHLWQPAKDHAAQSSAEIWAACCRLLLPKESEAVLPGAAVLGATAAGRYPSVLVAMGGMTAVGQEIVPQRGRVGRYHDAKYRVFQRLHADFTAYRRMMQPVAT